MSSSYWCQWFVSTKPINTKATNITSTASINCHSKKVRDCHIFFAFSFISNHITIDNYYCLLSLCKAKMHWCTNNIKMGNNEIKNVCIKNYMVIIMMT